MPPREYITFHSPVVIIFFLFRAAKRAQCERLSANELSFEGFENNSILTAYEETLAIRRDLAKDKSNARAQRDLSISLEKIGDIKLRAGDAAGALAAYEESL